MAINIELRTESNVAFEHGGVIEARELPAYDDYRFPYLRLIDPYGDTIFSPYQMVSVIPELELLSVEKPSLAVNRLLAVARRCGIHEYLWLIGD